MKNITLHGKNIITVIKVLNRPKLPCAINILNTCIGN